ncbi:hypothetical protein FJ364_02525 [Candidatus Dependentiae bacterium]|nr:hypothetical protein [Candidatus Dependentiae bacterium]
MLQFIIAQFVIVGFVSQLNASNSIDSVPLSTVQFVLGKEGGAKTNTPPTTTYSLSPVNPEVVVKESVEYDDTDDTKEDFISPRHSSVKSSEVPPLPAYDEEAIESYQALFGKIKNFINYSCNMLMAAVRNTSARVSSDLQKNPRKYADVKQQVDNFLVEKNLFIKQLKDFVLNSHDYYQKHGIDVVAAQAKIVVDRFFDSHGRFFSYAKEQREFFISAFDLLLQANVVNDNVFKFEKYPYAKTASYINGILYRLSAGDNVPSFKSLDVFISDCYEKCDVYTGRGTEYSALLDAIYNDFNGCINLFKLCYNEAVEAAEREELALFSDSQSCFNAPKDLYKEHADRLSKIYSEISQDGGNSPLSVTLKSNIEKIHFLKKADFSTCSEDFSLSSNPLQAAKEFFRDSLLEIQASIKDIAYQIRTTATTNKSRARADKLSKWAKNFSSDINLMIDEILPELEMHVGMLADESLVF